MCARRHKQSGKQGSEDERESVCVYVSYLLCYVILWTSMLVYNRI